MLSFSLCVMQHTKRSIKKNPTYWDYYIPHKRYSSPFHWHASSLTLWINIHAAGQSNWPLLSFLLLYWIAGIGIVIHYKHNLIHSHIQSLKPILKILKFKYLQIRHKPRNQLASKAQSFPRKSSNTASPIARHAKDFTWNRGCSSNSPPPGRLW